MPPSGAPSIALPLNTRGWSRPSGSPAISGNQMAKWRVPMRKQSSQIYKNQVSTRFNPIACLAAAVLVCAAVPVLRAQPPNARIGEAVPRDVRELYEKGMQYLAKTQSESGEWSGGQQGPGVTGMALM